MKYNKTLPSTEEMQRIIRESLRDVDLSGLTDAHLTTLFNSPMTTIQHRLKRAGTSWQALKREEKARRLEEIIAKPGRIDPLDAIDALGYSDTGSFYLFFKQAMGQTFTEWRMARQLA